MSEQQKNNTAMLYFVKGRPQQEQLDAIFTNHPKLMKMENSIGVNSIGPGYMLGDASKANPALHPDLQQWQESACGKFFFGWNKESKPGPAALEKPSALPGKKIRGGWIVPKIRKYILEADQPVYNIDLPKQTKWNGDRFLPGEVVSEWVPVAELATEIFDSLWAMRKKAWDTGTLELPPDCMQWCYRILAINYYFGPDEFSALGVLPHTFEAMYEVLTTFVGLDDFDALIADQEKKRLAST